MGAYDRPATRRVVHVGAIEAIDPSTMLPAWANPVDYGQDDSGKVAENTDLCRIVCPSLVRWPEDGGKLRQQTITARIPWALAPQTFFVLELEPPNSTKFVELAFEFLSIETDGEKHFATYRVTDIGDGE